MSAIAAPSAIPSRSEEVVERISEICTIPRAALHVMRVAENPRASASELKAAVEADPVLAVRVMRLVNSSALGLRLPVHNLQQAIAYLGVKQIRNLAMTASLSRLFHDEEIIDGYCRSELWRHMVGVGLCSRIVALHCSHENYEDAFLAGLLHDIGLILEDQYFHEPFREIIRSMARAESLIEAEQKVLGFDHCALGACLAEKWGLAEPLVDAIRYHHNADDYDGHSRPIVYCVTMANLLCTLQGLSSVGRKMIPLSRVALEGLGLSRSDILLLVEDLQLEMQSNSALLAL
ncbi:MAG: HDOD domain-containing protein [Planctomycetota bacterium]